MKLNRKGYMLVEMILASVIAMSIAYYLLNLTYKFKDKNEDIYNSTMLIADKILITKNIMNDFDGKIVELDSKTDKEIIFKVNGEKRKITIADKTIKYTKEDNSIIYKKTLANSMEIGKITFNNNVVTIPITSIYGNNSTNIKIFIKDNTITTFYYTSNYQTYTVPQNGYYLIELWGAQGGTATSTHPGGKGGYTSGYIRLSKGEKLYVYVGEKGGTTKTTINQIAAVTYNGGGNGQNSLTESGIISGSGGGATDIRLIPGDWKNTESLKSRIMVAGGGGGSWYSSELQYGAGGKGGNLIGGSGRGNQNGATIYASGGKQTSASLAASCGTTERSGYFGYGQDGSSCSTRPGGGGGYYGGSNNLYTSGGGSSFISGYAGVNAQEINGTPLDNTRHYSNKFFVNGKMNNDAREGNGQAKITYISKEIKEKVSTKLNGIRYIKDCINSNKDRWVEIQAIKDGINIAKQQPVTGTSLQDNDPKRAYTYIVDGIIDNTTDSSGYGSPKTQGNQCVTVDLGSEHNLDEIAVWHYYEDGSTYNNNVTSVSKDNVNWTEVIKTTEPETPNGKRVSAYR